MAITTGIYTVGGTVYGSTGSSGGRTLGPLSAHPHAGLWLEVGGLTADGLAFARGSGKNSGGTGYQRKQNQLLGGRDSKMRQKQRNQGGKAGKQGIDKPQRKQKSNASGKERDKRRVLRLRGGEGISGRKGATEREQEQGHW